ncbi:hypothetical protein BJ994_000122 [Arthrobacter pigmenti]|uniref:Uncharacterized protein n=1 Tax=Arthrobacter pigmenti TaxID=271432 RepID=A0A846RPK9_9MICC|nr:hypothetical protein [Arthrobacter pigmenti]NJC21046.1 hypothetical protein [Arthrobacter pigmenti]
MPPIPDAHHAAFEQLVLRARQLFGSAVEEKLVAPNDHRLPSFRIGQLSMIAEQWLVVEVLPGPGALRRRERWELDWDSGPYEALRLLEGYFSELSLAPTAGDALVARMIALVGDDGEVTVSTHQAEFDRVITVAPHRRGAMPFVVSITDSFVVVIDGPDLGWWTLALIHRWSDEWSLIFCCRADRARGRAAVSGPAAGGVPR